MRKKARKKVRKNVRKKVKKKVRKKVRNKVKRKVKKKVRKPPPPTSYPALDGFIGINMLIYQYRYMNILRYRMLLY